MRCRISDDINPRHCGSRLQNPSPASQSAVDVMTLTSAVDVGLIAMPDFLCERPSRRHRIAGAHLCRPEQQGKRSSIIQKIALGHWLTSECQEEKYAVAVC